MPASTTKTTAKPAPDKLQVADALEHAKTRVCDEFRDTHFAEVIELAVRLMAKYTREELKL